MFALESIPKHSYICEYITAEVYPRSLKKSHEDEYKENGEGCYIFEARVALGQWYCFDATRRMDQFGRFMNHAPGEAANSKAFPPKKIRGKYRVGFLASRDILQGEEITWDYGVRDEDIPWLAKPARKVHIFILCTNNNIKSF